MMVHKFLDTEFSRIKLVDCQVIKCGTVQENLAPQGAALSPELYAHDRPVCKSDRHQSELLHCAKYSRVHTHSYTTRRSLLCDVQGNTLLTKKLDVYLSTRQGCRWSSHRSSPK